MLQHFHKAFESRIRLGIMAALSVNSWLDFNALKELLELTDGNLASHLKALEKEGFILVDKLFVGRKPQTRYQITLQGRKAFNEHLKTLENLIQQQKDAV
jgi:DNA-binding HxlR family transcriptional regulator